VPAGLNLSDSEKADILAARSESHFQPLNDSLALAVIEMANKTITSLWGPTINLETQQWQGSGPQLYSALCLEASTKAGDNL
jgi:hypothetical protein